MVGWTSVGSRPMKFIFARVSQSFVYPSSDVRAQINNYIEGLETRVRRQKSPRFHWTRAKTCLF